MIKLAPAVVLVVAIAHDVPVMACSIFIPTMQEMQFSVRDGDTVPRNLVLLSRFEGEADGSSWWLTSPGLEPQRLVIAFPEPGLVTLTPVEPLQASTSYTLRWSASDAPPTEEQVDGDVSVRLTVTTTADDDTAAPAPPAVTVDTTEVAPDESSCGSFPGRTQASFAVRPDEDDVFAAYVLRDVDGALITVAVAPGRRADNGDVLLTDTTEDRGVKTYELVALDHAGNESAPTILAVDLGTAGGCSSTDAAGVSAVSAVSTLLVLVRRRRRRHRHRRP